MAEFLPELYQLVGAALRDVAQARFMSDVFSRQIAFVYERDGVLRRFPVPRVDIDEAEITLHFVIKDVAIDGSRSSSRNATIGSLFDQYSVQIVRETMQLVREQTRAATAAAADDSQRASFAAFEKRFLSDENRELLQGRLLQYFNESAERIVSSDCTLDVDAVIADLDSDLSTSVLHQPEVQTLTAQFPNSGWEQVIGDARRRYVDLIGKLATDIAALRDRYPDYRIVIDPSPAGVGVPGMPVSSIKIKSTVRNYKWSKVDVDEADLRNIRSLSPE